MCVKIAVPFAKSEQHPPTPQWIHGQWTLQKYSPSPSKMIRYLLFGQSRYNKPELKTLL